MKKYHMHLRGYVGGWDFDSEYVNYILNKYPDEPVNVLIESLGGSLVTALSIVSAFRRHGNVHVHFVGMNASAATIASMGAKSISIDSSAMYLVHKASVEFFKWTDANSEKLAQIIKEANQMKTDLEKMDANVAALYAGRCKKSQEEMMNLMKVGGWLTAKEAEEWGFVDEITEYEDDQPPVINDAIAADMMASGIPVPVQVAKSLERKKGFFARIFDSFAKMFDQQEKSSINQTSQQTMAKVTEQQQEAQEQQEESQEQQQETQEQQTENQEQQTEGQQAEEQPSEVEALRQEINTLRAEIQALKGAPGDKTKKIVESSKTKAEESAFSEYAATEKSAMEFYKAVKR